MLPYRRTVARLALVAFLILSWCLATEGTASAAVSFAAPVNYPTGLQPIAVAVGDFNRDGRLDLAVPNSGDGTVSILLGNAAGGFTIGTSASVGLFNPFALAVGDLDGDGQADVREENQPAVDD